MPHCEHLVELARDFRDRQHVRDCSRLIQNGLLALHDFQITLLNHELYSFTINSLLMLMRWNGPLVTRPNRTTCLAASGSFRF